MNKKWYDLFNEARVSDSCHLVWRRRVASNLYFALRDQILAELDHKDVALVDVRSPSEYSGELLAPAHLP